MTNTALVLTLPWPPSVNTYWRSLVIRNRVRVLLSEDARKYHIDCLARTLEEHGILRPMAGRLEVHVRVFMPDRRRRDLDNMLKALLDTLKKIGAIKDDSQIDHLTITRHGLPIRENGEIEVTIEALPDNTPLLDELE